MLSRMWRLLCLLLYVVLSCSTSCSSLSLPNIIDSYMVLQRAPQQAVLWGMAPPASVVTVTLDQQAPIKSAVDSTGNWIVRLAPQAASTIEHTLTITADDASRQLQHVVFGDVFICSGQSNMEMGVNEAFEADETINDSSNYPYLRLFTINKTASDVVLNDTQSRFPASLGSSWLPSSPDSVNGTYVDAVDSFYGYISAVCFYVGRSLYQRLGGKIPIGLIETAYSGTAIQTWSSPEALQACNNTSTKQDQQRDNPYAVLSGMHATPPIPTAPSVLWNGMWAAILNYPISAVIWYQGESDAGSPSRYACRFPAFIKDLRLKYNNYHLGFYFVLLSGYQPHSSGGWPLLRDAQLSALSLSYTGVGSALDLGDPQSPWGYSGVHSRYKRQVGERVAAQILLVQYQQPTIVAGGPVYADILWPQGSGTAQSMVLRYDSSKAENAGMYVNGTTECDDCCLKGSAFQWVLDNKLLLQPSTTVYAQAATVVLSANVAEGRQVVGLQYNYEMYPQCSLYNSAGFPALPFSVSKQSIYAYP